MADINLLPFELAPKESVVRSVKTLKKILIVVLLMYISTVLASISVLYYLGGVKNENLKKEQDLATSIKALKETEVKLILVQDRLAKVQEFKKRPTAIEEVRSFRKIIDILPPELYLDSASIGSTNLNISLLTGKSATISEFLAKLVALDDLTGIRLESLTFSQLRGYVILLSIKM